MSDDRGFAQVVQPCAAESKSLNSSHETLNRGEDAETYDITDWLYKEELLRGTKQSDPQKLKLANLV